MASVSTDTDLATLRSLRERGCAVVVFEPSEMNGADPARLEDCMVERGWDFIGWPEDPEDT